MNRLICLTVLSLAATPAAAQPIIATAARGEGQTVLVHYSDLNLSSESGMARLDSRLRAAARQVCDVRLDKESLRTMTAESRRSEEHTSELQSLMRISYAVFCLKKKKIKNTNNKHD